MLKLVGGPEGAMCLRGGSGNRMNYYHSHNLKHKDVTLEVKIAFPNLTFIFTYHANQKGVGNNYPLT